MLSYLSLSLGIIAASQLQIIPLISWLLIIVAITVFFASEKFTSAAVIIGYFALH